MHERWWIGALGGRRIRDCEGKPSIPTLGPVFGTKLKIRLHAQETLLSVERKNVSQLGTDRKHPRLKRTDFVAGAAVSGDLIVGVTNEADKELLGQELRRAPVQMEVDAALILGGLVLEIIGEPRNRRKLMPGGR